MVTFKDIPINNTQSFIIITIVWLLLSGFYINKTGPVERCFDCYGHINYTISLSKNHKLPTNKDESFEWFQPPAFYIINSFIKIKDNIINHINAVRKLSAFYGWITLLTIFQFLNLISKNQLLKIATLVFIATTPKFIIIFSTYTNDSLATMLSVLVFYFSYRFYQNGGNKLGAALLLTSAIGIFTKYTVLLPLFLVCLLGSISIYLKKGNKTNSQKLILILASALIINTPFMVTRNLNIGANYLAHPAFNKLSINNYKKNTHKLLGLPTIIFNSKNPFILLKDNVKNCTFLDAFFITPVYGEFGYKNPESKYFFVILWGQIILLLLSLFRYKSNQITKISFYILCISYLIHFCTISLLSLESVNYFAYFEYRFIAFLWLFKSILICNLLKESKSSNLMLASITLLVACQLHIILNMETTLFGAIPNALLNY